MHLLVDRRVLRINGFTVSRFSFWKWAKLACQTQLHCHTWFHHSRALRADMIAPLLLPSSCMTIWSDTNSQRLLGAASKCEVSVLWCRTDELKNNLLFNRSPFPSWIEFMASPNSEGMRLCHSWKDCSPFSPRHELVLHSVKVSRYQFALWFTLLSLVLCLHQNFWRRASLACGMVNHFEQSTSHVSSFLYERAGCCLEFSNCLLYLWHLVSMK